MKNWFLLFTIVLISSCGFHLVLKDPVVGEVKICDISKNCSPGILNYSEKIILQVKVKYAPFGTRITSHWYYINDKKPELIRERITDLPGTKDVLHGLKVPKFGHWKNGNYKVVIKVNNKLFKEVIFKIKKKPVKIPEDDSPLIDDKVKIDTKKTHDGTKIDKNIKKTNDSTKNNIENINTDDLLDQDI